MTNRPPSTHPTASRIDRTLVFAGAGYLAWTLLIFARVLPRFGSALPGDAGDPLLNAAVLAWNYKHLPFTEAWWNFPAFAPSPGVSTFTEHLAGFWPIASLVMLITGNPIAAYNATFVLLTAGTGVAMLLLARHLTGSDRGAVIAGVVLAFPLYAAAQVSHIQMLAACWMPLCLLALHKYEEAGNVKWLVGAAAAWALTFLSNGYFLVFFGVVLGWWVCWYLLRPGRLRHAAAAGAALALPIAIFWPVLSRYRETHEAYGFTRTTRLIADYGADVAALLTVSDRLPIWGHLRLFDRAEGQLFPGLTLLALCAVAGVSGFVASRSDAFGETRRRWRSVVWVITVASLVVTPLVFEASVAALLGALVLLGSASATKNGWRRKSHLGFYGLAAVGTWLLALGPAPSFRGDLILYRAPYHLLLLFPGVNTLRVPARFWAMTLLCLAVLAAFGSARLLDQRRNGWRYAIVIVTLLVTESFFLIPPAAVEPLFGVQPPKGRVIDMPVGNLMFDIRSLYSAVVGGYETLNGYSGYAPAHYEPLRLGLADGDAEVLEAVRRRGPVLVTFRADDQSSLRQRLAQTPPVFSWGAGAVWIPLDAIPPLPDRQTATVAVSSITASHNPELVGNLIDPELRTHWNAGLQNGQPHELVVTLERETAISGVTMELGSAANAFPAALESFVSTDGATWRSVWHGHGAAAAVEGALSDPLRVPMRIEFEPVPAKYVRLRQSGVSANRVWSIGTLTIHAPASH